MMMTMMSTIVPLDGFHMDFVSIKGMCIIPRILEPRNRKYISPLCKDISNFSKSTMNDSNQMNTEKSSKRIRQRELEDNYAQNKAKCPSAVPKESSKDQRRQDKSRQEEKPSKEYDLRVPRRSMSTGKPAWAISVQEDTHETRKSRSETKKRVYFKNVLKPIPYQDPALLQLRKERQKQRTEKTILKHQIEQKKSQQRREIYALNEVMKRLEKKEFEEFCHISGICSEE